MSRSRKRRRSRRRTDPSAAPPAGEAGDPPGAPPQADPGFARPFAGLRALVGGRGASPEASRPVPPTEEAVATPEEAAVAEEPAEHPPGLDDGEPAVADGDAPDEFVAAMSDLGVTELEGVAPPPARQLPPGPLRQGPRRPAAAPDPAVGEEDASAGEDPALAVTLARVRAVARRARRRSGAAAVEGHRLDLHGLGIGDALAELRRVVAACRAARQLRLRVVTGRGRHAHDGRSPLREDVEAWLRDSPLVQSVEVAPPEDGGPGCLLVQLRGTGRRKGPSVP